MALRPPIIPSSIREGRWQPHTDHCVVKTFSQHPYPFSESFFSLCMRLRHAYYSFYTFSFGMYTLSAYSTDYEMISKITLLILAQYYMIALSSF